MTTIFFSFAGTHRDWVADLLAPMFTAAGYTCLVDCHTFRAGQSLTDEMNAAQDRADYQILIVCPAYLQSEHCRHELDRSLGRLGHVLVMKRGAVTLPDPLQERLWLQFEDAFGNETEWNKLKRMLPFKWEPEHWLRAHHTIKTNLMRGKAVNLVGQRNGSWSTLVKVLYKDTSLGLTNVDFEAGKTATLSGTVRALLKAASYSPIPEEPDLADLAEAFDTQRHCRQVWTHFDRTRNRKFCNADFFAALRNLIMTEKRIVPLIHSRQPMASWIEETHDLSNLDFLEVEL